MTERIKVTVAPAETPTTRMLTRAERSVSRFSAVPMTNTQEPRSPGEDGRLLACVSLIELMSGVATAVGDGEADGVAAMDGRDDGVEDGDAVASTAAEGC